MGLKEAFKAAVQTAFNAAGNVKISITYTSNPPPVYDPSTGVATPNTTDYSLTNVIREDYEAMEIDGLAIQENDAKLLIPVDDLTPNPKIDDYVTMDSQQWNVVNKYKDPADALWTLQIRQ